MRYLIPALLLCLMAVGARAWEKKPPVQDEIITGTSLPKKLSDFWFFLDQHGTEPNDWVIPYELNSALFSDYAEKYRYIYVPRGKQLDLGPNRDGLLQFPVGSAIIKSFGYEMDGKPRLLETRVLLHRADGWLALPYVWNEAQTEAVLKVAGKRIPVTFTDPSGEEQTISYAVPNKNQCKECHSLDDAVMPIGPKLRNMQSASIERLMTSGALEMSADFNPIPDYDNINAPLDQRARAYLDVNCAHCHNGRGSASNSGLFLGYKIDNPVQIGILKRPVAAGRGSGGHEFSIAPGKPDESIMIYRLKSLDPGIAMPEVGRSTVHKEGVDLLSEWIDSL